MTSLDAGLGAGPDSGYSAARTLPLRVEAIRQLRRRRPFIPADPFQIIADVLLVERSLGLARSIFCRWPKTRRIRRQGFIG